MHHPTTPTKSLTAELIDAVFDDAPTPGLPVGKGRAIRRSRLGAAVATTTGKVLLCAATAAASVGGVYTTTDRVNFEATAPAVVAVPVTTTSVATTTPGDVAAPETTVAPPASVPGPAPSPAPSPVGEVAELEPETELTGCDKGQAISELASSASQGQGRHDDNGVDPCERSEERGRPDPDPSPTSGNANEHGNGNGGGNGNAGQGNGGGNAKGNGKAG